MMNKNLVIWLIVIAIGAIGFYLVNVRKEEAPKTREEIQREINRLENLLNRLQEDKQKAKEGQITCILVYQPVCGADGKTYSNECFASAAGVEISYKGECR